MKLKHSTLIAAAALAVAFQAWSSAASDNTAGTITEFNAKSRNVQIKPDDGGAIFSAVAPEKFPAAQLLPGSRVKFYKNSGKMSDNAFTQVTEIVSPVQNGSPSATDQIGWVVTYDAATGSGKMMTSDGSKTMFYTVDPTMKVPLAKDTKVTYKVVITSVKL